MAIERLRNLAKYGVINDVDAFDLPPEAFSAGVNIRFRNGKVHNGPVFRNVIRLGTENPRYTFATNPTAGLDLLFVGYLNGTISSIAGAVEADFSPTGYVPSAAEAAWSHTTLANVTYVNRSDRAPWYIRSSDSRFQLLSSAGWDPTWTASLLRTCTGALVALNVTKGGINSPTMVKTSSIPLAGMVPASWDITQPNTLATENILSELQGPITDACQLGSNLVIYGYKQSVHMTANGGSSVYTYDPLPFQKGSIGANCSVEFDGRNVVFGPDDLWQHDCVSQKSICDQKTRDHIYGSINMAKANLCSVAHNPRLKEITFSYVSGDPLVSFDGTEGCNRQAVWNYVDDTWTYDDLPSCHASTQANLGRTMTYEDTTFTYNSAGGSYQDLEDGYKRQTVYVGSSSASDGLVATLYAFDDYGQNSAASFPVDTAATKPRYLERDGIDLDELNEELRGYKTLSSIWPQARLGSGSSDLMIAAGASDSPGEPATFTQYQPYNGRDLTKLDFNVAGRFLSLRIRFDDFKEMTLTGLDLDVKTTGRR